MNPYTPNNYAAPAAAPRKARNPVILLILGILIGGIGLVALVMSLVATPSSAVDITTVSPSQLSGSKDYYIEQLLVVGGYATETFSNTMYYVAAYVDANDEPIILSLSAKENSEKYDELLDYNEDYSTVLGDMVLSGYFSCSKLSSTNDSLIEYFHDTEDDYGLEDLEIVDMNLTYIGETAEEYASHVKTEKLTGAAMGGVFALLGVVLMFLYLNQKKKAQAIWAQQQAQAAAYQTAQATPYPQPPQNPAPYTGPEDPNNWQ